MALENFYGESLAGKSNLVITLKTLKFKALLETNVNVLRQNDKKYTFLKHLKEQETIPKMWKTLYPQRC